MTHVEFLLQLVEGGEVRVGSEWEAECDDETRQALRDVEARNRLDMPRTVPPLDIAAACWGLSMLHAASSLYVDRRLGPEVVLERLARPCPVPASPSTCYSVDLALRYLPDLWRLTKSLANEDPLVAGLVALGSAWPLSSVGMDLPGPVEIDAFIGDGSLALLYADRVIAREDLGRLCDSRVRAVVREALGAHEDLAPEVVRAMSEEAVA